MKEVAGKYKYLSASMGMGLAVALGINTLCRLCGVFLGFIPTVLMTFVMAGVIFSVALSVRKRRWHAKVHAVKAEEEFFEIAYDEVMNHKTVRPLFVKAYREALDDTEKRAALYVHYRMEQLKQEAAEKALGEKTRRPPAGTDLQNAETVPICTQRRAGFAWTHSQHGKDTQAQVFGADDPTERLVQRRSMIDGPSLRWMAFLTALVVLAGLACFGYLRMTTGGNGRTDMKLLDGLREGQGDTAPSPVDNQPPIPALDTVAETQGQPPNVVMPFAKAACAVQSKAVTPVVRPGSTAAKPDALSTNGDVMLYSSVYATARLFTAQGRLVDSGTIQPGYTYSWTNFPFGEYMLKFDSSKGAWTVNVTLDTKKTSVRANFDILKAAQLATGNKFGLSTPGDGGAINPAVNSAVNEANVDMAGLSLEDARHRKVSYSNDTVRVWSVKRAYADWKSSVHGKLVGGDSEKLLLETDNGEKIPVLWEELAAEDVLFVIKSVQ